MDAAQELDAKYHHAKLIARAFNDPESLWREHDEVRRGLLTVEQPTKASGLPPMEVIAKIHRRLHEAGLLKPRSGVMN
jgi:hypothetical protein